MSITANRYRRSTGEKLTTFKVTLHLTADDIAHAVLVHTGAAFDHAEVVLTEALVRESIQALFDDGIDRASYAIGDNSGRTRSDGTRAGEVLLENVTQQFTDLAFDGERFIS